VVGDQRRVRGEATGRWLDRGRCWRGGKELNVKEEKSDGKEVAWGKDSNREKRSQGKESFVQG
jgi:hypothetical protein